jgi:hypothetical protein
MPLSPQMPREQFTQKFPWFERTLLLTGAVFFLGFCFRVNRIRSPWADEVLGWTLLTDSSARHMMLAWRVGADGGGWPFYALGRLWFLLFGRSILSFRLFSATAFASAFVVTWRAARYFYSTAVVAVAMYVCWLCSWTILQQSSEARFYGLFLFAASTVFYFFAKSVVAREASVPLLLGVFCSNAFLVSSHVLWRWFIPIGDRPNGGPLFIYVKLFPGYCLCLPGLRFGVLSTSENPTFGCLFPNSRISSTFGY